jgi:hypothetical protein
MRVLFGEISWVGWLSAWAGEFPPTLHIKQTDRF